MEIALRRHSTSVPARSQNASDLDFFVAVVCWKPACVQEGPHARTPPWL
jgi:hypothetical protein